MVRKIFFAGIFVSIIASIFVVLPQVSARTIIPDNVVIDETARQMVLDATVKISFFAPEIDENGQVVFNEINGRRQVVYTGGTGLGTVVKLNGEVVIITHDHWKLLDIPQAFVELSNAQGDLLDTLNGPDFGQLVRYRDGGTTVVTLPAGLATYFTPVSSDSAVLVENNDVLLVAYRNQDDSVTVEGTVVSSLTEFDGKELVELTSVSGKVVYTGNSGGGVFLNGQLVANMWATVLTHSDGSDKVNATERSRAALLPTGF